MKKKPGLSNRRIPPKKPPRKPQKKQPTLANKSDLMIKRRHSNSNIGLNNNRNSSLSNRNNEKQIDGQRNSHMLAHMNLYNNYQSSKPTKESRQKVNKTANIPSVKEKLSKEIASIGKGFQRLNSNNQKNRSRLEEKLSQIKRKSLKGDNYMFKNNRSNSIKNEEKDFAVNNLDVDYARMSFYKRKDEPALAFNHANTRNSVSNKRGSLFNKSGNFLKERKSSLANNKKQDKEERLANYITNAKLKNIETNNNDIFNRASFRSGLEKNNIFNSKEKNIKKEKSKKKKKKEINFNLNLKFEIGNITNKKVTQNIKIDEINKLPKTDRAETKQQKQRKKKDRQTFQKETNTDIEDESRREEVTPKSQIHLVSPINANSLMELYSPKTKNPTSYYKEAMLRTLRNKVILGKKKDIYSNEVFFNHFRDTYLHFGYLKKTGVRKRYIPMDKYHNPPFANKKQKILILDLDETLVHISFKKSNNEAIPLNIEGSNQLVG